MRPGYPNTVARVADSPPEKPEREDWISAASIEFFWRLTDPIHRLRRMAALSYSSSSSSAPPPLTTTNSDADDDGLVPGEEQAVRAWLVQQGFEPGDLRSEKEIDYREVTPMAHARSWARTRQ